MKAFFVSHSLEYERKKQTETIDSGGIYTKMRIDMHQSED